MKACIKINGLTHYFKNVNEAKKAIKKEYHSEIFLLKRVDKQHLRKELEKRKN